MEKNIRKILDGYNNFIESNLEVQKTPGYPGTILSSRKLKYPTDIDKYMSFVVQIILYTTKVVPGVANTEIYLAVHMSHPRP